MSSCTEIDSCLQQIYTSRIDSIIKIKEQLAESTFGTFANQKIHGSIDFIDSVYRAKSNIIDSTFDSSLVSKLNQLDSAMIDSLMTNSWCSFFSQSLDKVIAIHVGLFTALITVTVAIFLTKYWFDNKKFEDRLKETQKQWTEEVRNLKQSLKDANKTREKMEEMQLTAKVDLEKLKKDMSDAEKAKGDLEKKSDENSKTTQGIVRDLLESRQMNDSKMEIYVKYRLLQIDASVSQVNNVLTEICQYLSAFKKMSVEKMSELLAWIEEKGIIKSIFDMIEREEKEKILSLHSTVLELKKYADTANEILSGQLNFKCIDDFFKRFES